MRTETIDFNVLAAYLPYLINGDMDELDKHDHYALEWLEKYATESAPTGFTFGHWATTDDADEFGLCEASGMRGVTERVQAVYLSVMIFAPSRRIGMKTSELIEARLEINDLWRLVQLAENEADRYDDEAYTALAEKLRKIITKGGQDENE